MENRVCLTEDIEKIIQAATEELKIYQGDAQRTRRGGKGDIKSIKKNPNHDIEKKSPDDRSKSKHVSRGRKIQVDEKSKLKSGANSK